jgi:hypothetical protein
MRAVFLAIAILTLTSVALPSAAVAESRDCGAFRATSSTGSSAHVRVSVYTGPVSCRQARRVLRYSITHGSSTNPKGWICARGGPDILPTAAGYSCEAQHPHRIVTGRFLY